MEDRYFVIKLTDIEEHLTPWYKRMLKQVSARIAAWRADEGKVPINHYLVINQDEPFLNEVLEVMRRNGVDI